MIVRFYSVHGEPEFQVEYGWGDGREPLRGERVSSDGSDPAFPIGLYRVRQSMWLVGLRGPQRLSCWLERHPEGTDGSGQR